MTIYDAAMAAVLIAGMVRGAWRGITWQLASIGSLLLGYLFAYPISAQIAPMLPGPPEATRAMAMAGAYAVVSGGVFAAAWMVRGTIRRLRFEAYDRHLGMMLGGVEGVGVAILLTLLTVSIAPKTRGPIFDSPSGRVVGGVVNALGPVLPGEVRKTLEPFWNGPSAEAQVVADDGAVADADPDPEIQARAELDPPALPPLESVPALDDAVQPASAPAVSGAQGQPQPAPRVPGPPQPPTAPSPRSVLDAVVERGKQNAERFVVETLDSDPEQKAASFRELIEKDKARLQSAVTDVVGGTAQNLTNQVSEAVDATRQDLTNQLTGAVDATRQNLTNQVSEAVDATRQNVSRQVQNQTGQLQKQVQNQTGQLQKQVQNQTGQLQQQVQNQAGRIQGKARELQGQVNRAQNQMNQTQERVNQARRRFEREVDGAIQRGQQQIGRAVEGAINQPLQRLGVPEPAPAPAPAPVPAPSRIPQP